MTHKTLSVYWSRDIQGVLIAYRCFPWIFLAENWFAIFVKNSRYSEKYSAKNTCSKSTTSSQCELFSTFESEKNIRTMSLDVFTSNFERISHFALVFLVLTLTFAAEYIKLEKNYYCFIFSLKNVICFCQFLITSSTRLSFLI